MKPVSFALSVTILTSGLIFASRPLAGSGEEVREIFSRELPNVPGKALTAVQVDYAPGGTSKPHHHSGVVLAYVVSGEIRSQVGNAACSITPAKPFSKISAPLTT